MNTPLVRPFPTVGERMAQAYYDLYRAETAEKPAQVADLGPLDQLPRPWDIASIADPDLRLEAWLWLDQVVAWINRQHVWDTSQLIPPCWPQHPNLVHELGTVADQRRRAGLSFTSEALEDWHRYCLSYFFDRMRTRYRDFCEDGHESAPSAIRMKRYHATPAVVWRNEMYEEDISMIYSDSLEPNALTIDAGPRLEAVDASWIEARTGELKTQPGN